MAKISTTAEINSIRLKDQTSNPATPSVGYSALYSKYGELYLISLSGVEGPFGTGGAGGTGDVVGPASATNGNVVLFDGTSGKLIKDGGAPLTAGHTILDEGTPLTQRANLNFIGSGVTVTDDAGNNRTVVTITTSGGGGGHTIQDEGVSLTQRTKLNFVGTGVTVIDDSSNDATKVTITASGGGTSPIQPDSISGLVMWLKADAIVGLSDSDPITTWEDSSSANNDASQSTANKKPLYKTSVINGLPVVRFDGTDDSFSTTWVPSHPFTIFFVAKSNSGYNTRGRAIAGTNNWFIGPYDTKWDYFNVTNLTPGAPGVSCSYIAIGIIQEASRSDLFIFDIPFGGHGTQTATVPGTVYIGESGGGGECFNGDIAEIIGYSTSISNADRLGLVAYLRNKYGI